MHWNDVPEAYHIPFQKVSGLETETETVSVAHP